MKRILLTLMFGVGVVTALADSYDFVRIPGTGNANADAYASYLRLDVTAVGTSQILFQFLNVKTPIIGAGGSESDFSITAVYLEEDLQNFFGKPMSESAHGLGTYGVVYKPIEADPSNKQPPGGANIGWKKGDTAYWTDPTSPTVKHGIGAGEWFGLTFTLLGGHDFDDVITALDNAANNKSERVALHFQGLPGSAGGSASYVINANTSPSPVPEASSTLTLLGLVFLAMSGLRQRFGRK